MIGRSVWAAMSRHDRLGERPRLRRGTDQHRRLHLPHHLGQTRPRPRRAPVLDLVPRPCVRALEVQQVLGPVLAQHTVAAQRPEPARRLLRREPFADHLVAHHVRDPQPRRAGAVDHHPLIPHPRPRRPHRGERRRQHHRRGALHVVVERAHPIRVAVQDPPRVRRAEVLPVQHRLREQLLARADVGLDQLVVAAVTHPGVPLAQVHLVVEQRQVVGAHVQHDRQHPRRVDPRGGGVHRQLPDRDLDAAHTLVADPEDALGVGGHQQVDVLGAQPGVAQRGLDLLGVVDRQVHPAGAAELDRELLDRQADRRGVDDRQHLLDVLGEQLVEQHLVAGPQVGQVHPLRQIARRPAELGIRPPQLPVQRATPPRAATRSTPAPAAPPGERRPPVDHRRPQHRHPPRRDPRGVPAVVGPDQFVVSLGHLRALRHRVMFSGWDR